MGLLRKAVMLISYFCSIILQQKVETKNGSKSDPFDMRLYEQ